MSDSSSELTPGEPESSPPVQDPAATLEAWLDATGYDLSAPPAVIHLVRKVGAFLENSGQLPRDLVVSILKDIDLAGSAIVVQLPASGFVKSEEFNGYWLTDTGITADSLQRHIHPRRKKIYAAIGVIPAIKAVSKSVFTEYRPEHLFTGVIPQVGTGAATPPASAGTQYLVVHQRQLREI